MNLLSGLINEYKEREANKRLEAMEREAEEVRNREAIKREGLNQINTQGPLSGYEMAELLDGSEVEVIKDGNDYTVRVKCASGLWITIDHYTKSPRGMDWGRARIHSCSPDDPNRTWEFFVEREAVADFIGRYLAQGGA